MEDDEVMAQMASLTDMEPDEMLAEMDSEYGWDRIQFLSQIRGAADASLNVE